MHNQVQGLCKSWTILIPELRQCLLSKVTSDSLLPRGLPEFTPRSRGTSAPLKSFQGRWETTLEFLLPHLTVSVLGVLVASRIKVAEATGIYVSHLKRRLEVGGYRTTSSSQWKQRTKLILSCSASLSAAMMSPLLTTKSLPRIQQSHLHTEEHNRTCRLFSLTSCLLKRGKSLLQGPQQDQLYNSWARMAHKTMPHNMFPEGIVCTSLFPKAPQTTV